MKLQSINQRFALAAAVAGAMFAATSAFAQYRVDNGNARDANNRIGSGGFNQSGSGSSSPYALNNSIVTGNVTGGREFRGFIPYTDPGAFRGQTAGTNIDRFVRQSAGVPVGVYNNNNAQNVLPFYGDSRGTAPPAGFAQEVPGTSGYLPAPVPTRTSGDLRLGNPFSTIQVDQPRPGQLVLPGPVDASQTPTVITASPLYGVRQWKFGDQASEAFLQNYTDVYSGRQRGGQFDQQTLERMRSELGNQVDPGQIDPNDPNGMNQPAGSNLPFDANTNPQQLQQQPGTPSAPGQGTTTDPNGTSQGIGQLTNDPNNTGLTNNALSNDIRANPGMRNRLLTMTPTAAATSPQYRALQERLRQRRSNPQMAEIEANQRFRAQQRAMEESAAAGGAQSGQPGQPMQPNQQPGGNPNDPMAGGNVAAPGGAPGGAPGAAPGVATPGVGAPAGAPGGAPGSQQPIVPGVAPATPQPTAPVASGDRPLMIKSLTTDMKDSAVVNLMKEAEQLMRDGKYTTALDKYDMAEQVVPNDPLVLLGRATAELGASYYQRADAHLREAFTKNPALLMGQYDLHTFLGDERLGFLVKDLKDLANKNKSDPRPVFLLSYIAYNTGNERFASAYLDQAEKRTNGRDPFFVTIRKHWSLPEGATIPEGAELNK